MAMHKQNRSREQKDLRRRRNERAFLFDKDLTRCLGDVDRNDWEFAISISGGDVAVAGLECGISDLPRGVKALWGKSAEEALGTYLPAMAEEEAESVKVRWTKTRPESILPSISPARPLPAGDAAPTCPPWRSSPPTCQAQKDRSASFPIF